MTFLLLAYHQAIVRPLFNGLMFIYIALPFHDLGISIILLTIAVRVVLFPATLRAFKSQAAMRALQPKLKEIQERHKSNKEEQTKQIMALYAAEKMNPFSGCLPLLVQFPVLIALYQLFWKGITASKFVDLYPFIAAPLYFGTIAFGVVDLMQRSIPLALLAGVAQFGQARLMPQAAIPVPSSGGKTPDLSRILSLQVKFLFPVLIAIWSFSLPAALPLYWTIMNGLAIIEQLLIQKYFS